MANDQFGQPQSESQDQPQGQQPPINPKHALIGKVFETLAGGARSQYEVDPNTGQTVETKVPLKPGELWRGILAAGLTGMMAGAGERGPGSAGRAFQKGGTAVQAQREKARDQAREQAQQDFKNRQNLDEMTLRKHADARDQMRMDAELKEHALRLSGLQLENKSRDLDYKAKLVNMEQGFSETIDRLKLLGGKPAEIAGQPMPEFEGQTAADAINAAGDFYKFRATNKDARNVEFKPVFDPDTGKYQMYVIPDPDRPITKQEAEKINSIYGIKPVAGANTVREVYAWLNRPGAAEEARKRNIEEAQVAEAQARTQTARAEAGAAQARADYERSRMGQIKKSDEAYEKLADVELSLDRGEKVDPKVLAKARPVIRQNLQTWLAEEAKRIKDAESGDPDAKASLAEATAQRAKWEKLWDADKGIQTPKTKTIDGVTIPEGHAPVYKEDGSFAGSVPEANIDAFLASPQGKGLSKTKPQAAPGLGEKVKKVGKSIAKAFGEPTNIRLANELYGKPYMRLTAEQKKDVDAKAAAEDAK